MLALFSHVGSLAASTIHKSVLHDLKTSDLFSVTILGQKFRRSKLLSLVAPYSATASLVPLPRLVVPGPPIGVPLLVVGIVWIHRHRCLHLRWDRTAAGLPCVDYIVRVGYVAYTWQVVLRDLVPSGQ